MKKADNDFEAECRARFLMHCRRYHESPFHADKRKHAERAYAVIDTYLDWLGVQSL